MHIYKELSFVGDKSAFDAFKNNAPSFATGEWKYDEFIILGDASSGTGLEISEQEEVDETFNCLLMMCPEIVNVTTVIAWRRAENQRTIIYSWYKSVTGV